MAIFILNDCTVLQMIGPLFASPSGVPYSKAPAEMHSKGNELATAYFSGTSSTPGFSRALVKGKEESAEAWDRKLAGDPKFELSQEDMEAPGFTSESKSWLEFATLRREATTTRPLAGTAVAVSAKGATAISARPLSWKPPAHLDRLYIQSARTGLSKTNTKVTKGLETVLSVDRFASNAPSLVSKIRAATVPSLVELVKFYYALLIPDASVFDFTVMHDHAKDAFAAASSMIAAKSNPSKIAAATVLINLRRIPGREHDELICTSILSEILQTGSATQVHDMSRDERQAVWKPWTERLVRVGRAVGASAFSTFDATAATLSDKIEAAKKKAAEPIETDQFSVLSRIFYEEYSLDEKALAVAAPDTQHHQQAGAGEHPVFGRGGVGVGSFSFFMAILLLGVLLQYVGMTLELDESCALRRMA